MQPPGPEMNALWLLQQHLKKKKKADKMKFLTFHGFYF